MYDGPCTRRGFSDYVVNTEFMFLYTHIYLGVLSPVVYHGMYGMYGMRRYISTTRGTYIIIFPDGTRRTREATSQLEKVSIRLQTFQPWAPRPKACSGDLIV